MVVRGRDAGLSNRIVLFSLAARQNSAFVQALRGIRVCNDPMPARPHPAWLATLLAGCSAAPSQDILGSFFPAWMLCAGLGVVAALVARRLLGAVGLAGDLVAAPLVYGAIAVAVTLLIWLLWFGG
jgi:hypothetical protein